MNAHRVAFAAAVLLCTAALRGFPADDPLVFSAAGWDFGAVDRDAKPETILTVANRSAGSRASPRSKMASIAVGLRGMRSATGTEAKESRTGRS